MNIIIYPKIPMLKKIMPKIEGNENLIPKRFNIKIPIKIPNKYTMPSSFINQTPFFVKKI